MSLKVYTCKKCTSVYSDTKINRYFETEDNMNIVHDDCDELDILGENPQLVLTKQMMCTNCNKSFIRDQNGSSKIKLDVDVQTCYEPKYRESPHKTSPHRTNFSIRLILKYFNSSHST